MDCFSHHSSHSAWASRHEAAAVAAALVDIRVCVDAESRFVSIGDRA